MEKAPRSPPTAILETLRLTREVAGKRLVNGVTIEVARGEILALVGPSGSGKTSFLRLLNRLDEPTSGAVFLEDRDYHDIAPRELRRRVGMMTQIAFLFPGTIAANLRFGPAQRGESLSPDQIDTLLSQVGLAGRGEDSVSHLSGGESQRVSLARALANSPSVLLLDEPTSALDDSIKFEVESLILAVVKRNALTCLVVTHDLAQAARVADRVALLNAGKVTRIGPTQEVLRAEADLY